MHLQPQGWRDADRKLPGVWLAASLGKLMGSRLSERSFLKKIKVADDRGRFLMSILAPASTHAKVYTCTPVRIH